MWEPETCVHGRHLSVYIRCAGVASVSEMLGHIIEVLSVHEGSDVSIAAIASITVDHRLALTTHTLCKPSAYI